MSAGNSNDNNEQKTAEALIVAFKRRGLFDNTRREVFQEFSQSECRQKYVGEVEKIIGQEIARDPELLSRDRRKSVALMEGVVDRSKETYRPVRSYINMHTVESNELENSVRSALEEILAEMQQPSEEMHNGTSSRERKPSI